MSHSQSIRASQHAQPPQISQEEYQLILDLHDRSPAQNPPKLSLTLGERVADRVAAVMGSWTFIIAQSILLAIWVTLNIVSVVQHWDPYPFILLNLMLSFQAAYAAPVVMMSHDERVHGQAVPRPLRLTSTRGRSSKPSVVN